MSNILKKLTGRNKKAKSYPPDIAADAVFMDLYEKCKPFTMTSIERMYALFKSINYVLDNHIPGDFVECGVWKGGSSMMIAHTLKSRKSVDRNIFLYDTFEGMSTPSDMDISYAGESAAALLSTQQKNDKDSIWCFSPIDEVKKNIESTGYRVELLKFVQGKVEDTLLHTWPGKISLLRLDTDWYESTRKEMEILYPLLEEKGVLIIDDFGHWEGAKKAVTEYFNVQSYKPFLQRIDNTGIIMIKPVS
ncbi:MAG: TylF/MycF/NovP-related O-methyltransferase [Chitinophagaceae bacterium]